MPTLSPSFPYIMYTLFFVNMFSSWSCVTLCIIMCLYGFLHSWEVKLLNLIESIMLTAKIISVNKYRQHNGQRKKEKNYEKFEDGKWVIRSRKSNDRQDNGKTKNKK